MPNKDVKPEEQQEKNHRYAAIRHEQAARHHYEAAKHYELGNYDVAGNHAHIAHGHSVQAKNLSEDAAIQHANMRETIKTGPKF